jgi:hypothetical protein
MRFQYRENVLIQLARHGVIPRDNTPPELIYDFINALYVYEIRSLRRRLLDGAVAKRDYANEVESLRRRYPILSLPVQSWPESD